MTRACFVVLAVLTVITGLVYPLAMTVAAKLLFPDQAYGSLLIDNGRVAGSRLLGKHFEDPKYFWSRPSATSPFPYNAASSSGSNLGPLNPDLLKAREARRTALRDADPANPAQPPVDLLTASGSGLDPHISSAAAEYQASRVARLRGIDLQSLRTLIAAHTSARRFGLLGEPVVNVVTLNRALDGK